MVRSFTLTAVLPLALSLGAGAALAQTDSTGSSSNGISNYGDVTASSTWNRVSGKPATATRWPTWNEVTNKPATFPPAAHHHDSRYVRKDTNDKISGNLDVDGRVKGDQLVTGDVGGDRWCRATASGRIECTHSSPMGTKCVRGTDNTDIEMWRSRINNFPTRNHLEMHYTGSYDHYLGDSLFQCRNGKWVKVFEKYSPPRNNDSGGGGHGSGQGGEL